MIVYWNIVSWYANMCITISFIVVWIDAADALWIAYSKRYYFG